MNFLSALPFILLHIFAQMLRTNGCKPSSTFYIFFPNSLLCSLRITLFHFVYSFAAAFIFPFCKELQTAAP